MYIKHTHTLKTKPKKQGIGVVVLWQSTLLAFLRHHKELIKVVHGGGFRLKDMYKLITTMGPGLERVHLCSYDGCSTSHLQTCSQVSVQPLDAAAPICNLLLGNTSSNPSQHAVPHPQASNSLASES